ncbi:SH3 domain-containing protein 19 isoform X2 [Ambystoma mexicanum]|uniref:SH3 domain-containing protein 19 isoform X2 n=1 Tax=Ambystoma mexicanum TaxID=8296 RepID=UPI0037E99497
MAEAWLEEDEEELRELRDHVGNRRNRRTSANPATERSERNKPEYRFSGQGALSSIRAAIKRTSRTTTQSEQQRERRRPEITIVAAEPLGPAWFASGSHGASGGLAYAPPASQWRNDPAPAELPPSYEQVIKEITRVPVNASNNNAAPRLTTTSSTQTDFQEEADCSTPQGDVKTIVPCAAEPLPKAQTPPKPPRPSLPQLTSSLQENLTLLTPVQENSKDDPSNPRCPVPRPRSKSNLRPVVTGHNQEDEQEDLYQSSSKKDSSPDHSELFFQDNFLDYQMLMGSMSTESNQSSVFSRIKAFESQSNVEGKKPEIAPRSFVPKLAVPAGRPTPAPKPASNRASGDWDSWTETKPKPASRELPVLLPKPQETAVCATGKPELPKKPQSGVPKSTSLDSGSGLALENFNDDGERKVPIPAPRPLIPKKTIATENPASWTAALKPVSSGPRISVANQAKAFSSLGEETTASCPTSALQSRTTNEWDLISFDDDFLTVPSAGESKSSVKIPVEPLLPFPKPEPLKEQPPGPALLRKPTVIRIPSKSSKSLSEDLQIPPPLPSEKPIGIFYNDTDEKPSNLGRTRNDPEPPSWTEGAWALPAMPTRPRGGKVVPARPPAQKGPPGRPPPPKASSVRAPVHKDLFRHSSSDVALDKKNTKSGMKRSKSQLLRKQEPELPPRPKPGHMLYNKYMLPVPHGIAQRDFNSRNPEELSCQRGDVLVLLEQVDCNHFQCQKGEESGEVHLSKIKIITPLENKRKDRNSTGGNGDSDTPHALVLHDFPAEHADDLSLVSGEFVQLLEKIDDEWYQGQIKGRTGIFPASYVKVLVDVPGPDNGKRKQFSSVSITGPRCIARFEFSGDQDGELSFAEGDVIRLKEYTNEEWAKGEFMGKVGIFPLNFVEVVEDLPSSRQSGSAVSGFGAQLKSKRDSWGMDSQSNRSSGEWYEALFDFTAETDEDLPFRKGERIFVTERLDSEWYRGRLKNREGVLPTAFVQPLADASRSSSQPQGQKKSRAKALYDFSGENEDELSFKAGSMITVLKYIDDDWMSGELQGRSGIFPRNFVQVL